MASFFARRSAVVVGLTGALVLAGCQLLLPDGKTTSGTGGSGTTSSKASTTGASMKATTGNSMSTSMKTSSSASTSTGSGATVGSSTSSAAGGCTVLNGFCAEGAPFPACPAPQVSCGGDLRCDQYCTIVKNQCTGGRQQFESDEQCCALCAAIVGNTMDKSTLCCRVDGLTKGSGDPACTKGGAFGTIEQPGTIGVCGYQVDWACDLLGHACEGLLPTGCVAACKSNFMSTLATTSYRAGDTSSDPSGILTYAMRALTDASMKTTDCAAAEMIACPTAGVGSSTASGG